MNYSRRSRRGGKVGISRLWRDFQGSVGAGGNLLLVFAGFHAPAFSTALRWFGVIQFLSAVVKVPHYVWSEADRNRPVQVLMDCYRTSSQSAAEPRLIDLP